LDKSFNRRVRIRGEDDPGCNSPNLTIAPTVARPNPYSDDRGLDRRRRGASGKSAKTPAQPGFARRASPECDFGLLRPAHRLWQAGRTS
jgi:hypothetical protein